MCQAKAEKQRHDQVECDTIVTMIRAGDSDSATIMSRLTKVYERGYPDAAYMLGVLHDDAGDYHAAFRFYNEAHSKDCVKATFALGVMYEIGRGTQRHYGKAFQFYEEALRGGDGGEWSAEAPPGLS